jgi:hypothetical protein
MAWRMIAAMLVLLGGLVLLRDRWQAPAALCATAIAGVQAHHVHAQPRSIQELIAQQDGQGTWKQEERWGRGHCTVTYTIVRDSEVQVYTWEYTPATGHVTSADPVTRRLSGW